MKIDFITSSVAPIRFRESSRAKFSLHKRSQYSEDQENFEKWNQKTIVNSKMKNQRLKENDKVKTYHSLVHNLWTTTNIIIYNVISIPKLNVNGEDDTRWYEF